MVRREKIKIATTENSFKKFDYKEKDRDRFVAEEWNWVKGGVFVLLFCCYYGRVWSWNVDGKTTNREDHVNGNWEKVGKVLEEVEWPWN